MDYLRVANESDPSAVAGAIAKGMKESNEVIVRAVGAIAVNQAVKGIAIARGYLAPIGKDIVCVPAFVDVEIEGETKTAIKFIVKLS